MIEIATMQGSTEKDQIRQGLCSPVGQTGGGNASEGRLSLAFGRKFKRAWFKEC